jgi:hypothetical protein
MKAYRGSRIIGPLILKLGSVGGELSLGESPPVSNEYEVKCAPEPVWKV